MEGKLAREIYESLKIWHWPRQNHLVDCLDSPPSINPEEAIMLSCPWSSWTGRRWCHHAKPVYLEFLICLSGWCSDVDDPHRSILYQVGIYFVRALKPDRYRGLIGITAHQSYSNIVVIFFETFPLLFLGNCFFFKGVGRPVLLCYFCRMCLCVAIQHATWSHWREWNGVHSLHSYLFGCWNASVLEQSHVTITALYGSIFVYTSTEHQYLVEGHLGGCHLRAGVALTIGLKWATDD